LSWRTRQLNAVDLDAVPEADDDASLYRLFGFSIHVGIKFRKRALYGRLRSHFQVARKKQYAKELLILKGIVEKDRSVLPGVIKFQDQGKMTFPHQALLPFMRKCSKAIKATLNCKQFQLLGKSVILTAKQEVLSNRELKDDFNSLIQSQKVWMLRWP